MSTVLVLGSLHGYMLQNPNFTLSKFVGAIDAYRPDVILTEVRPDFSGPLEGSIDGGIEQSIIYAYGDVHKAAIIPIDWFDDQLIEDKKKEERFETPALKQEAGPHEKELLHLISNGTMTELHGHSTQILIKKLDDIEEKHGVRTTRKRNERICQNMVRALDQNQGKRVLVTYGLSHKYFLDECLGKQRTHKRLMAEDWLNESKIADFKIPKPIKATAHDNIKKSRDLLKKRLESGFYKESYQKLLVKKLPTFDKWILHLEALKD